MFFRGIVASYAVLAFSVSAYATSGWDRHSVDVEGRYRIHGANGNYGSTVSLLDGRGNPIAPPLIGFTRPPQYATTPTHLLLYGYPLIPATTPPPKNLPPAVSSEPTLRYVAIRKSDSKIVGPMTDTEFASGSFGAHESLHWNTPWTATDSFHVYATIIVLFIVMTLLALALAIYFALRRFRSRKHEDRVANA
ncbi:MAG: hypothetical protein N2C12_00030 [Planctomycetales bacterium]